MCFRAFLYAVFHSIRVGYEGSKLEIVNKKASDGRVSQSGFQLLRGLKLPPKEAHFTATSGSTREHIRIRLSLARAGATGRLWACGHGNQRFSQPVRQQVIPPAT